MPAEAATNVDVFMMDRAENRKPNKTSKEKEANKKEIRRAITVSLR